MARTTGAVISRAFELQDKGMPGTKIAEELKNKNIGAYLRLRPVLEKGETPPYAGSKYSVLACQDYIDNYLNKPEQEVTEPNDKSDPEALRIRVSFELGETARRAIDGLLALVGVKL